MPYESGDRIMMLAACFRVVGGIWVARYAALVVIERNP